MYPPALTDPMRAELTSVGVQELTDVAAVDAAVTAAGTTFVMVNSVCGCAAGGARPGLALALQQAAAKPDRVTTVFAGVDREATAQVRQHLLGFPPSSPSMALFKNGEPVWMLHRHQIEGRHPEDIADAIQAAFGEHCA
ncbi:MAG: BrxA/BrxB family bacilliredoxin [Planctomycetota bacterium]|nr:MAG: BrxA/BrxB family bacilliredoxin [Planctomycetota bacterium]